MFLKTILLGATGISLTLAAAANAALQPPLPDEAGPAIERVDVDPEGVFDEAEFDEQPGRFCGEAPNRRRAGWEGPRERHANKDAGDRHHQDGRGMARRLRAMVARMVRQELRQQRRDVERQMRQPAREEGRRSGKRHGDREAGRHGFAEKGPRGEYGAMHGFGPHDKKGKHHSRSMRFDRQDRQGRHGWQDKQGRHDRGRKGPGLARPEGRGEDVRCDQPMMKQGPQDGRIGRGHRGDRDGRGEDKGMRRGRHQAGKQGPRGGFPFMRLDEDRDGVITPDELQADPGRLTRIVFRLLDRNGDGEIDRMEARRLMKQRRGGPEGER